MKKVRSLLTSTGGMNALSSVMAIILGLIAGFVIMLLSNPSQSLRGFGAIITGGFDSLSDFGYVLHYATPIIMTGLSVGFAGKTGLFNIGASGQFTFGMYASILVAVRCASLPGPLLCLFSLIAGVAAGAIWGMIPGMLKAMRNVHEVIACIMMNYLGMILVNYLIPLTGIHNASNNFTMPVPTGAELPKLGLNVLFSTAVGAGRRPSPVGSGIIIAILASVLMYILLEKTKFGYELKSCGFNREAARYAGINENRGIVMSMVVAGALSGLGGALLALSGAGTGIQVVDSLAAEGFNGIPVALLGLFNPIGILFSGILIAYLTQSGFNMQTLFSREIIDIIVAVIIYFSALALLLKNVIQYIMRDKKEKPKSAGDKPKIDGAKSSPKGGGV